MEELRSTEILDREIHEDARKKAEKLLRAADSDCDRVRSEYAARLEATKKDKSAEYAARLEAWRNDSVASVPLEKQRRLVSRIDAAVKKALDTWFESIGCERRLAIYRSTIERFLPALGTSKISVRSAGYAESELVPVLHAIFGKDRIASLTILSAAEARLAAFSDGLLLETADRSVLCRVTKGEIFDELLSVRRQELAEALYGGRLPE